MDIIGNIKLIQDTVTGTSKGGNEWKKRTFVITTHDKYPQDLAIDLLGDNITLIDKYQVGNPVSVSINLRGNEYNGKYYTSIVGWRVANHIASVGNDQQNPAREETADLPF
jgi:hypothetical protein